MTEDQYLQGILSKKSNNGHYTQNESTAYHNLSILLHNWFNEYYIVPVRNRNTSAWSSVEVPSLEIQQSGSRAKGTAIKGSSDMDIFLSITDRGNVLTIESCYNDLFEFMKKKNYKVRKQNVSIGLEYYGMSIDLVPAKKCNSSNEWRQALRNDDHYLWSHKHNRRTLTNIQKHIDLVRQSNAKNEMMLMKIWRNCHNVDIASIYIEILVREALQYHVEFGIANSFRYVMRYIRDNIVDKRVVDPSNSNNVLSDTMTYGEKLAVKNALAKSLNEKCWGKIIW